MREPLMQLAMKRYLLADGGMTSFLWAAGASRAEAVELLNVRSPELVEGAHQAFRAMGADVLTTNTFGSLRVAAASGMDVGELCRAGAQLARAEADTAIDRECYVLGSLALPPGEDPRADESRWTAAAAGLAAGADAILIETVSETQHVAAALELVRRGAPGVPVVISLAFKREKNGQFGLTTSGEPLDAAIDAVVAADPDGLGANCGVGVDGYDMSTIIAAMRGRFDGPIMARPSAGTPSETPTGLCYPSSPEMMSDAIWGLVRAGANIIGGCCGVHPEYTEAFRAELDML